MIRSIVRLGESIHLFLKYTEHSYMVLVLGSEDRIHRFERNG